LLHAIDWKVLHLFGIAMSVKT